MKINALVLRIANKMVGWRVQPPNIKTQEEVTVLFGHVNLGLSWGHSILVALTSGAWENVHAVGLDLGIVSIWRILVLWCVERTQ